MTSHNSNAPTIIYTITDEAPALATYSFLPVIRTFTEAAGVHVKRSDISLAARILANFPDKLTDEQKQSDTLSLQRVKWYRMAEFVGRWSMIDVFVVIILVSLIQLGPTMSITPGAATLAFSGVVIVTMLAAMSFEPQLIWKNKSNYE